MLHIDWSGAVLLYRSVQGAVGLALLWLVTCGQAEIVIADEVSGQTTDASGGESKHVLRHAVFFKFKESSTDQDIRRVVEAFRALPNEIETIKDLQWGTNNSPEGLNDGFTHAFILTFDNEQGRAVYLPHPAHKAFGDVLRPHLDQVFVVDYFAAPGQQPDGPRELKHAVFFKFKDDAPGQDVKAVEDAFAALPAKIPAIKAFEWGTNNSPEKHDHGFTHCFVVSFASEQARSQYLPHPDHQAFVQVLRPVLDKVRVVDFWAQD